MRCLPLDIKGDSTGQQQVHAPLLPPGLDITDVAGPLAERAASRKVANPRTGVREPTRDAANSATAFCSNDAAPLACWIAARTGIGPGEPRGGPTSPGKSGSRPRTSGTESGRTTSVPETGTPGSRRRSVEDVTRREAQKRQPTPLTSQQQRIQDTLRIEHPGLHPDVAAEAARGGERAMGPGGAGGDVVLTNGGRREVSVRTGAFTAEGVGYSSPSRGFSKGYNTDIFAD